MHLVGPLGFEMDDTKLRRAGLDYHELARVHIHASLEACFAACGGGGRYAFTTKASRWFSDASFAANDLLIFGPETRGLPADILGTFSTEQRLRIPMRKHSRSINLANAVSVVVYEAWRQLGYDSAQ